RVARLALLDVLAARRVPTEGRAWVSGAPLMPETAKAIAAHVGDIDWKRSFVEARSVFANVGADDPGWWRLTRAQVGGPAAIGREFASQTLERVGLASCANEPVANLDGWRRRRLAIARAMIPRRDHLVATEVDEALSPSEAADVLGVLRTIARSARIPVIVSAADPTLVQLFADRVLVLTGGVLTFDGPPRALGASGSSAPREFVRAG